MRLTDLKKLDELRAKLKRARAMADDVDRFPPVQGMLHINGEPMKLEHTITNDLVKKHLVSIIAEIESLGVEVDE